MTKKAIILLSGGLDSATCLAIAKDMGFECYAMSFRYGQRHTVELDAAKKVADAMGVKEHIVIDINLGTIGGSALTADIEVPKHHKVEDMGKDIPITYVPARNTIFLSFALAWGEVLHIKDIFIGVNALDYSGYPDCRPEYIESYENMANFATKLGTEGEKIKIHTPLISMTKGEIVKTGVELGVDYSLTHTCYDPDENGRSCGVCDSCLLRLKGFEEYGMRDPIDYM
ncbi:7-cyano-7-deazaguanine synthase QueC [bacterium]|nr:7-cyano-7-deazaguanine synthase QueC [bacterium]